MKEEGNSRARAGQGREVREAKHVGLWLVEGAVSNANIIFEATTEQRASQALEVYSLPAGCSNKSDLDRTERESSDKKKRF